MSQSSKKEYLEAIRSRYQRGNRKEKGVILDEFCAVSGLHRKHAIRALGRKPKEGLSRFLKGPRRGRKPKYQYFELTNALRKLWFDTDQMCSVNFKAAIPEWLPCFVEEYPLSERAVQDMLSISAATIGRILEPSKARTKKRGGTKPGSLLRTEIPIRTDYWDVTCPGFMEADTVAHCGGSMSGEFAWSLTLTDIDTTWTEVRIIWNKLAVHVRDSVEDIEKGLPFKLLGFDSDNGGEFINKCLVHYFAKRFIPFTRSREYHKNDNAHVEQKNFTHVRQILGYNRIDCQAVVPLINELLKNEVSLLKNHFYPSLKLEEKMRLKSKIRRRYSPPKTPYQRVLESPHVSGETKRELSILHSTLNPIKLQRTIKIKLAAIFRIIKDEHQKLLAS